MEVEAARGASTDDKYFCVEAARGASNTVRDFIMAGGQKERLQDDWRSKQHEEREAMADTS